MDKQKQLTLMIILFLTAVSVYQYMGMLQVWQPQQMDYIEKSMNNTHEPPYKYRVLMPAVSYGLSKLTGSHQLAQLILSILVFGGMLWSVWRLFDTMDINAHVGVLIFGVIIPFTMTPFWPIGDYFTVIIFALAMYEFGNYGNRIIIIVLMVVGAFNREQVIFLVPLFLIMFIGRWKWARALEMCLYWAWVYFGIRYVMGFEASRFTWALHIEHNTVYFIDRILPLWGVFVYPLVSWALFKSCFRISWRWWSLMLVYTGLFFLHGNMWELAKYLPAFLIYIPMVVDDGW